jgi:NAD(P)-dependent dehydrogenase (short-subunit alcohol dehydrogenase family)
MKLDFAGQWALVTGAGEGIGRACALLLAELGADVIVNDLHSDTAKSTAAEVEKLGRRSAICVADIGNVIAIEQMLHDVAAVTDRLHVLINNAGFNQFRAIEHASAEEWDRQIAVNLRGAFMTIRDALPLLKGAGEASVINVASVHAHQTAANISAYAAAKNGLIAMTRSLCQELGALGIRVNTISPGYTSTPMMDRSLANKPDADATMRQINSLHPVGRIAAAREIAYLAAFLSSKYARFITGTNVTIDGGLTSRLSH